jgi:3-deoxy-manno-octulosonate cytidylyltransferase (CMP-KDO synthetase)
LFRAVIPARYASARLPGKPLRLIAGKPMIQHVHERARASRAAEVWIATDDARIEVACRKFGARVAMTAATHASGTDRLAELAAREHWADEDIVVNVQGDEPLLPSALIDQVAALLVGRPDADIATLTTPIRSLAEFLDPNVVKAAISDDGTALYFSRAPIPWPRDGASGDIDSQTSFEGALRHIGLYAYRTQSLKRLASLPPSKLEQTEKLEQLRALENGMTIVTALSSQPAGPGVDTEEDLLQVFALIR